MVCGFVKVNYSLIFNSLNGTRDPPKYMRSFHSFNMMQKLAYPFAIKKMRERNPDLKL